MLKQLQEESNRTLTENGCAAYRSSENECLNLFSLAGAMRSAEDSRIAKVFARAYAENPDLAMKLLFYARDIRGGLGERRFFRAALRWTAVMRPASAIKNIPYIAEYGRFDDLLWLLNSPCEAALGDYLRAQLTSDLENMAAGREVSLLAKWLPSVNASSPATKRNAQRLRGLLGMSEKKYRRTLSALRTYLDVLEKRLCARDYSFAYEKLPSKALFTYRKAFDRNDRERYRQYLANVSAGKTEMKTASLYPYDIVRACREELTEEESAQLNAAWQSLGSYDNAQNAIAVVDGSGSMYCETRGNSVEPIDAAVSLGIYFAEHSSGAFAGHFITFSKTPRLVALRGESIADKAAYCRSFREIANTDVAAVFNLILRAAVRGRLPQSELPEIIYIISDMEFDAQYGTDKTAFAAAQERFRRCGYRLPTVVFWNVNSRSEQFPVRCDETGAVLVSGASPSLFRFVISQGADPSALMHEVIDTERYAPISA